MLRFPRYFLYRKRLRKCTAEYSKRGMLSVTNSRWGLRSLQIFQLIELCKSPFRVYLALFSSLKETVYFLRWKKGWFIRHRRSALDSRAVYSTFEQQSELPFLMRFKIIRNGRVQEVAHLCRLGRLGHKPDVSHSRLHEACVQNKLERDATHPREG